MSLPIYVAVASDGLVVRTLADNQAALVFGAMPTIKLPGKVVAIAVAVWPNGDHVATVGLDDDYSYLIYMGGTVKGPLSDVQTHAANCVGITDTGLWAQVLAAHDLVNGVPTPTPPRQIPQFVAGTKYLLSTGEVRDVEPEMGGVGCLLSTGEVEWLNPIAQEFGPARACNVRESPNGEWTVGMEAVGNRALVRRLDGPIMVAADVYTPLPPAVSDQGIVSICGPGLVVHPDQFVPWTPPAVAHRPVWRGAVGRTAGACRWGADGADHRPLVVGSDEYRRGLDVLALFAGDNDVEVAACRKIGDAVGAPVLVYQDNGKPYASMGLLRDGDLVGLQMYPGNGEPLDAIERRLRANLKALPDGARIAAIRAQYTKNMSWSSDVVRGLQPLVTRLCNEDSRIVADLAFGRGRGDYAGDATTASGDRALGSWLEQDWAETCAHTATPPRLPAPVVDGQPKPPSPVPPKPPVPPAPTPVPVPPVPPIDEDAMPLTPFHIRHREGLYYTTYSDLHGRPTRLAAKISNDGAGEFQAYYAQLVRTPASPAGSLKFDAGATVELDCYHFVNNPLSVADATANGQPTSSAIRRATRYTVRRSADGTNWRFDTEPGLSLRPLAGSVGSPIQLEVTDASAADVVLEGLDGKELHEPF